MKKEQKTKQKKWNEMHHSLFEEVAEKEKVFQEHRKSQLQELNKRDKGE